MVYKIIFNCEMRPDGVRPLTVIRTLGIDTISFFFFACCTNPQDVKTGNNAFKDKMKLIFIIIINDYLFFKSKSGYKRLRGK